MLMRNQLIMYIQTVGHHMGGFCLYVKRLISYCILVHFKPYDIQNLGQHWLREWVVYCLSPSQFNLKLTGTKFSNIWIKMLNFNRRKCIFSNFYVLTFSDFYGMSKMNNCQIKYTNSSSLLSVKSWILIVLWCTRQWYLFVYSWRANWFKLSF